MRFEVNGQDNTNRGHDYGTDLTEPQKNYLIEYFKKL